MYEAIITPREQPVVTPEQLAVFGRFDLPQTYVYGSTTQYTDEYQMLLTFIEAATDEVESMAAQACLNEEVILTFDFFPGQADPRQEILALNYAYETALFWYGFPALDSIELVRRPVLTTTSTNAAPANPVVTYNDLDGNIQTLDPASYMVQYNKITLNVGSHWPLTDRRQDSVQINYWAGYSADTPAQVPSRLVMAILFLANHMYNVRQVITVEATSEVGYTLCRMLRTYRSMRIPR